MPNSFKSAVADTRQMVLGRSISAGIVRVLLITGGSGASLADEVCTTTPSPFNTVSLDFVPALELRGSNNPRSEHFDPISAVRFSGSDRTVVCNISVVATFYICI